MTDRKLPPAELDVMSCLWDQDELTARDIRESLELIRPMSHSSVSTLLNRLVDKGLVTRQKGKNGKAFVFSAAAEPASTQGRLVCDLLDRVFAGSGVNLVASLLESRPPTSDELSDLGDLIEELRRQKTRPTAKKRGGRKQ